MNKSSFRVSLERSKLIWALQGKTQGTRIENRFFSFCILACSLLISLPSSSQQSKIDSLLSLIKSNKEDTNKVNALNELAFAIYKNDPDSAILLTTQATHLAEKINFKKGAANAYGNSGIGYLTKGDCSNALEYFFKALQIDEQLNNKLGIAKRNTNIGNTFYILADYEKSADYYQNALKIAEILVDKNIISAILGNLGNIYKEQKDYQKAFYYYVKALTLGEELGDKTRIQIQLTNIGSIYYYQEDFKNSLEYYFKALKVAEELESKSGIASNLTNIAAVYVKTKQYSEAEVYLKRAISLSENIGSLLLLKNQQYSFSVLDSARGNYKEAYEHYKKYIAARDSIANNEESKKQMRTEINFEFDKKEALTKSEHYAETKRQQIVIWSVIAGLLLVAVFSIFMFNRWRVTQKQKKIIEVQKKEVADAFKNIETVSALGQKITATLNLEEVIGILHGHIRNVMDAEALVIYILNPLTKCLEIKYTIGKHGGIIAKSIPLDSQESFCVWSFKQKKEVFINNIGRDYKKYLNSYYWSSIPNSDIIQSFINIPLIVGDNAIGVISVQSFKSDVYSKEDLEILKSLASFMSAALNNADAYAQLNSAKENLTEQKKLIEEKNKDITDSINYAQRIQRALLASDNLLTPALKGGYSTDYFVLFKPKDIVSGDFYWATEKDSRFYLAVCDSTGHGVPGAFMSLLNISFLNEAINEEEIYHPNEIFNHVRHRLIQNISQDGGKDGMDGILVCFDKNKKTVCYSAAHNSPVIVTNGTLTELDSDNMPVGMADRLDSFQHQTPNFEPGTVLYLYTDGFADQFGGPKGKKLKYKQLNDLLLANSNRPLAEQRDILEKTFEDWRGDLEQVDDVLIIGIKV